MKTKLEQRHIDFLENPEENSYTYLTLISRIIMSNMSLEDDLGDVNDFKNIKKVKNSYKAFGILMGPTEEEIERSYKLHIRPRKFTKELTEDLIKQVNNTINKDAMYISNEYRTFGDCMCGNPNIPVSTRYEIKHDMEMLLYRYYHEWDKLDVFEREARFNIEFLRIHPYEDGNGRTSRLILNFNMLRQGYAPIVLTGVDREAYFDARNREDVKYIRDLFERKSAEELKGIEILMSEAENDIEEDKEESRGKGYVNRR